MNTYFLMEIRNLILISNLKLGIPLSSEKSWQLVYYHVQIVNDDNNDGVLSFTADTKRR